VHRAKDVISAMPPTASDHVDYGTGESEEFFGDEDGDEEEFMDIGEKHDLALDQTFHLGCFLKSVMSSISNNSFSHHSTNTQCSSSHNQC